jgi:hypothetical protein
MKPKNQACKLGVAALIVSALLIFSAALPARAIVGLGFHYGLDLSLGMDEAPYVPVKGLLDVSGWSIQGIPDEIRLPSGSDIESILKGLGQDVSGYDLSELDIPAALNTSDVLSAINALNLVTVSRTNWRRSPVNAGAKLYVDAIPFIEAVEVSCNFGLWQYDGALNYADLSPDRLTEYAMVYASTNKLDSADLRYRKLNLTTKDAKLDYIGLSGTPYAKLQLDATVRKTILNLWIVKLSGGAGFSSHFATPLLTAGLIKEVVGETLNQDPADMLNLLKPGGKISKKIVQKIIDDALGKPVYGAHVLLGVKAKVPGVPVGLYIDGKYMIPFTEFDKDVGGGMNGFGLLVNLGLSLSI